MEKWKSLVQIKTESTDPTIINQKVIRLESQSVSLRLPFGGYVWNRPTAVLVGQHGQTERLPITDITRTALWALSGIGMMAGSLIWLKSRLRKKGSSNE